MQLKLIHIDEINSTNDFARKLIDKEMANQSVVISTNYQSNGKGQSDAVWESEKGKNLLISIILRPETIPAEKCFYISMIAALGIANCISDLGIREVKIKWPNDIYINSKKIAGILIQNDLNQKGISSSIIGIGLNVNQLIFSESIPNPVSLKQLLKKEIDLHSLKEQLIEKIWNYYDLLMAAEFEMIKKKYEQQLFRYNRLYTFASDNQIRFKGKIKGIDESGKLIVKIENKWRSFDMKELIYVL
ncbi:MAG: biotin--[acetyl-CoA-carboxylase] ligase [Bacteroidetes bacterium]|nr:biotin--[acetyl-CoA-carboxylase] ligase [Bacteroidota bacterium]